MSFVSRSTEGENALVASARLGDQRAFRRLAEPYLRALDVHCYRMLGSPHDAQEVVQETLLRAWLSLERFERRSTIRTWLYRIATNACLDEIERRSRRPESVLPYPDARLSEIADDSPTYDPVARYALHQGIELAFLAAIQTLPGRQRAVLLLREVLGWTSLEVAELLETTATAVNSALQRARETIDRRPPIPEQMPAAVGQQHELLERYMDVWRRADVAGFVALLRDDAVLRMPPQSTLSGATSIRDFLGPRLGGNANGQVHIVPTSANNRPAFVMYERSGHGLVPHGILVLEITNDTISAFDAFQDPTLVAIFETAETERSLPPQQAGKCQ